MDLYSQTAYKVSKIITQSYSTSFSFATSLMNKEHRDAIYGIYGFVRFADEIVDTFHEHNKAFLLDKFETDLQLALKSGISMNPVLHSFQLVVNKYKIPYEYINAFLTSMKYDLEKKEYKTKLEADEYIYGSADVVGLMCLRIFCDDNDNDFQRLYGPAMRLGSAFQKVNFLRDLKNDAEILGRNYFPRVDYQNFDEPAKQLIVNEIKGDFKKAYVGIKELPPDARLAVLVAFLYYKALLKKLENTPAEKIQQTRLRISNFLKITILVRAVIMSKLKMI